MRYQDLYVCVIHSEFNLPSTVWFGEISFGFIVNSFVNLNPISDQLEWGHLCLNDGLKDAFCVSSALRPIRPSRH